jgi:small-conductance mechanosensitive channel
MAPHLEWLKDYDVHLSTILQTLGLLLAALIVISLVNLMMWRLLQPAAVRVGLRSDTVISLARVLSLLLWLVTLLFVLELWGISGGGIWAWLAGAATIIGAGFLATWAIISNVTAALFLAIWRPFHLGDRVEMLPENVKGRAVDRNLMFTVLREESGSVLQIPNNLFFQKMFRVGG